jgi:hypothetical protein
MLFSWHYKRFVPPFLAAYTHFVLMSLEGTSSSIFIWDVQVCCVHVLKIGWGNKRTTYRNRNPNCCPVGASCFCDGFMIRQKYIHFVEDYLLNIPTTFCSNWPSGSREEGRYIQVCRLWRRTQSDDNTLTLLSGSSSKKTNIFYCRLAGVT